MAFPFLPRHPDSPTDRKRFGRTRPGRSERTAGLWVEPLEDRTLLSFGLAWAFNVGGTGQDQGTGITTDSSGSVYVTGWSLSDVFNFDPNNTNPNNPNNTLTNPNPGNDNLQFVAKYSSDQTFQWVTLLGTSNEFSGSIALDGAGNVYVAYVDESNNSMVAKVDAASDTLGWQLQFAGSGDPSAASGPHAGVAIGPLSGDVYVAGRSSSSQAFVAKLDPSGNILWNQTLSGDTAEAQAVAVDNSENIYVTGDNRSGAFVSELDSGGSTLWTGSVGSHAGFGVAIGVDGAGNVYVAGDESTIDFFAPTGFFVVKLAPENGSLQPSWQDDIPGTVFLLGTGNMAVDGAGNVYTIGTFVGSVNFDPRGGSFILNSTGNQGFTDIFVSKLDTDGNLITAADLGGPLQDFGRGIAVDNSSPDMPNLYITGGFRGTANFDPSSGAYYLTVNGGSAAVQQDVFVSKLIQTQPPSPPRRSRAGILPADALRSAQALAFLPIQWKIVDIVPSHAAGGSPAHTDSLPVALDVPRTALPSQKLATAPPWARHHASFIVTLDWLFAGLVMNGGFTDAFASEAQ